ncbi:MAG: hypothetical protein R3249_04465 [Nitriliruptorales bacterium]|nr:hypothetical protein [Nitriliruptorales bacterium]
MPDLASPLENGPRPNSPHANYRAADREDDAEERTAAGVEHLPDIRVIA